MNYSGTNLGRMKITIIDDPPRYTANRELGAIHTQFGCKYCVLKFSNMESVQLALTLGKSPECVLFIHIAEKNKPQRI